MSSGSTDGRPPRADGDTLGSVEFLLFDSLVHHLVEKGVLTKNDALSIVQTAAEVVRGRMSESDGAGDGGLSALERTYSSFEALPDRYGRSGLDGRNVHALRVPLHDDRPRFPTED
jgi:hypothetical protein